MSSDEHSQLTFASRTVSAKFIDPAGRLVKRSVEIRTNPLSGRTCRLAYSRIKEKETGTEALPPPPPDAEETSNCPFCRPRVESQTPRLNPDLTGDARLSRNDSLLFPNLFPYGSYSAVSLFNNDHFVEIGKASASSYTDSFSNCCRYLTRVIDHDPQAVYMAITQNHLPSAGGSLIHPHLQVNADSVAANHHRFLQKRANDYYQNRRPNGRGRSSDSKGLIINDIGPFLLTASEIARYVGVRFQVSGVSNRIRPVGSESLMKWTFCCRYWSLAATRSVIRIL